MPVLKYYDPITSTWRVLRGGTGSGDMVITQAEEPAEPTEGMVWVDTDETVITNASQILPSLLAIKQHSAVVTYDLTNTASADLDADNLALTFTVPQSGQVVVRLTGYADMNTGYEMYWNIRDGVGDMPGTTALVTRSPDGNRHTHSVLVTGLTPGAALTWKWGAYVNDALAAGRIIAGAFGPLVMEVHDAATSQGTIYNLKEGARPKFAGAKVYTGAAVPVANAIMVPVPFDATQFDPENLHDPVVNNDRVLLNRIGFWRITASLGYTVNANGDRRVRIYRNGSLWSQSNARAAVAETIISHSDVIETTTTTDYVSVYAYQTSGVALSVLAGPETFLAVEYLGAA